MHELRIIRRRTVAIKSSIGGLYVCAGGLYVRTGGRDIQIGQNFHNLYCFVFQIGRTLTFVWG